jgi:hypothetical protein
LVATTPALAAAARNTNTVADGNQCRFLKIKTCDRSVFYYIANDLQYKMNHSIQFGRSLIAVLLIGLVLLLNAMAACPALHELIHKDADHADHQCAVTMFAHGKVESASVDVPVIVVVVSVATTLQIKFSTFSAAIENLPQGRAPPAVTSSTV